MSTTIIKSKRNIKAESQRGEKKDTIKKAIVTIPANGEQKIVAITEIDFSPLNYRRYYSQEALNDFASELKLHGIISPVTLRKMPSGRYELVAGERRLRAAQIAELKEIPAIIKELTDDEVTEIQLSENLQRENPHPLDEAQAIKRMNGKYKTVDEIAARLGKSRSFVYSRIRLLSLIEPLQEMFFAEAININEAFEIAALNAESQQEFFNGHCINWKEQKRFSLGNLYYALNKFRYDLKRAPFDTKDKTLNPQMGACTKCPFNSATLKSLFPELAKEAICSGKDCYQLKCKAHFIRSISIACAEHQPTALIYDWGLSDSTQRLIDSIDDVNGLTKYIRNSVTLLQKPEKPEPEDFLDESFADDEQEAPILDEQSYKEALAEYNDSLAEYEQSIENGSLQKGLLVSERGIELVYFSLDMRKQQSGNNVTAKQVQDAIKSGGATVALLQAEMERLREREKRSKELDGEKIQLNIHESFIKSNDSPSDVNSLTEADLIAARLLVYQSLDWSAKRRADAVLFETETEDKTLSLYERLAFLTELQYSYLIRLAVSTKSESKLPAYPTGDALRRIASAAGTDIEGIVQAQQEKAKARDARLTERLAELQKKIELLMPAGE